MSYDPENPYATPPNSGQPPVTGQPQPSGPMPPGSVPNYLIHSVISLICCGGVFAIPALVYASQVDGKLAAGDYQGAVEASENAKKWLIIAVALGVLCGGGMLLLQLLAVMAEVNGM